MAPTTSVVMPTFNASEFLRAQLDALAAQDTDADWELIVSDNGSTDDTRSIAAEYDGRIARIRIIDSSDRPGAAHARNRGASAARGRLLLFCDGDDVAVPLWVHEMTRALHRSALVGGRLAVDRLNRDEVREWRTPQQDDELTTMWGRPYVLGANLGCTSRLFQRLGGFDESFVDAAGEDVDFSLRAAALGVEPAFVRLAVIHYRYRSTIESSVRQAQAYGRATHRLYAAYRPDAMPTVRDDAREGFRFAKRYVRCRMQRQPIPGSLRMDFARRLAQTREMARSRRYWSLRTREHEQRRSPAEWRSLQVDRSRRIARAARDRLSSGGERR